MSISTNKQDVLAYNEVGHHHDTNKETLTLTLTNTNMTTPTIQQDQNSITYLTKTISFFASVNTNTPCSMLTINQFLDDCQNGKYQALVEAIRVEPDKEKRNELKKELPAVTIQSEVCERRNRASCTNNSLLCLDFDDVDDVEAAKQMIADIPYAIASCTSAGGRGIFVLVALTHPVADLKPVLAAMQADFHYKLDVSCSDHSRLRFVSYDPDLIVKDSVIPYDVEWHLVEPQPTDLMSPTQPPVFMTELTSELEKQAIACLGDSERAIRGDSGHSTLLLVAFKLVRGLLIDPALAANLAWKHYNPRCVPPWSESERPDFDRKFSEAAKLPLLHQTEGWLLHSGSTLLMPEVSETYLQDILSRTKRFNFHTEARKKVSKQDHVVVCIDQVQKLTQGQQSGLCTRNERVYCYTGAYWNILEDARFIVFLTAAAIKMGVPRIEAKHHAFGNDLFKQFQCVAHLPAPAGNGATKINLKNGTFVISDDGGTLQPFDPNDFLTYQLPFDHDPQAVAPIFHKYLNRVLPEQELRDILAEYTGYIFARNLKLEKIALLYGGGANGKSVFADILNALLGKENVCSFSMYSITKLDSWQRAELEHKLLNYSSEINGKMESEMFKKMVSGEPVEAHRKYKDPYTIDCYARMMFNCNLLPHEVELTNGFFRRLLIIPFRVQIPEAEQIQDLAKKIIATELSGVFNWVLSGLNRLLERKKFSESAIIQEIVKNYRIECDSAAMFLRDKGIRPGNNSMLLKNLYQEYVCYCSENGYRATSNIKFSCRLRSIGFTDSRTEDGKVFFCDRGSGTKSVRYLEPSQNVENVENVG